MYKFGSTEYGEICLVMYGKTWSDRYGRGSGGRMPCLSRDGRAVSTQRSCSIRGALFRVACVCLGYL